MATFIGGVDESTNATKKNPLPIILSDGNNLISPSNPLPISFEIDNAIRFEEDSVDSNIEYYGKAVIGSNPSDSVWQIKRIDNTSGVIITWANSNKEYTNAWIDREVLNYG